AGTVLVLDDFAHEHRTHSPLTTKAQTLQCTQHKNLFEILRDTNSERAEREPDDRDLQHTHTTVFVCQDASSPATHSREQQSHRTQHTSLTSVDTPKGDQGRNDKGKDHVVKRINRPTHKGGKKRALAVFVHFTVPTHSVLPKMYLLIMFSVGLHAQREVVETRRVLYQDFVAHLGRGCPLQQQIAQHTGIRHAVKIVMGPVAAPHHAIRCSLNQSLRPRCHFVIVIKLITDTVRARQFAPPAVFLDTMQQRLETWMLYAFGHRHMTHVVKHTCHWQAAQTRRQLGQ